MQRLIFFIVFMTTLLSSGAFAQHSDGFAGISFGISREEVIEEVMKMGYEPFGQRASGDHIVIPVYNFGELPVQVDFIFNKNDKFFAFEIRTGRVERARLSKSFEAAAYMSEQFTLKYGKPSGAPAIDENSKLLENFHNKYQEWFAVKSLDVVVSVVQKDGRYFVLGTVVHRKLAKEKKVRSEQKIGKTVAERPVF